MVRTLEAACIASTLAGYIVNVIFERALGDEGRKMLKGSRVWSFYAAMFFQGIILPCCIGHAIIQTAGGDVFAWLSLPIESAAVAPHAAAIGYFLRDLLWPLDPVIIVHHVVSAALCYTSISGHLPGLPPNAWMLGGFALELGSLVANVASVRPAWRRFTVVAAWLMGLSNLAGLVVCVYIATTRSDLPPFTRWINPAIVLPLVILRQQASNAEARLGGWLWRRRSRGGGGDSTR